ncbi:hypothetical protein GEMRC1_011852 [Eukaryota sp. GEM-RC1]
MIVSLLFITGFFALAIGFGCYSLVSDSVDAFLTKDPAASSKFQVFLTYPGIHALIFHRIAHVLYCTGFSLLSSIVAYVSRFLTSIEIHPGATIGKSFNIDHGCGVVIGETVIIHNNVTIYSGVVLGGRANKSLSKGQVRHPELFDDVIVGCSAAILGPIKIGQGAKIGANAVVLEDVDDMQTVVGVSARPVMTKRSHLLVTSHRYSLLMV